MNWTKFNEHLQQPIFFIIWVSLGTVFLLFSWKGLTYQEERQFRKQFGEILNERDRIARQIENSELKNQITVGDFKTKLIKRLLQSYLNEISAKLSKDPKILNLKKKELGKILMQVPKPFGSQLHVSIARNGYLLFAPKPSLEREFGKKWYKDLLKIQYKVRLKKARKIDHRKLMKITGQIFTLPLESTEYLETIDRCSLIYNYQNQSYYYLYPAQINFKEKLKYFDLIMAIPASSVDENLIKKAILEDVIARYPNKSLKPSSEDYIKKSNGKTERIKDNMSIYASTELGLSYIPKYTSFTTYCKQHLMLVILLIIPGLVLTLLGGLRALRYHFEWTLMLIFLFSLSLSYLLIDQFYLEASQQKKISLLMNAQNKLNKAMKVIELNVDQFSTKLASKMSEVILDPETFKSSNLSNRSLLIRLTSNGRKSEFGGARDIDLQTGVLRTAALAIVTMQKDWNPNLSPDEYKRLWHDGKLLMSQLDSNLNKYRLDHSDYNIFKFNKDSYLNFIQHNKATYGKEFEGRFIRVPLFQQGYYFWWKKTKNAKTNRRQLFVTGIPGPEYLKSFMKWPANFKDNSNNPVKWYVRTQKQIEPIVNQIRVPQVEGARLFDKGRAKRGQLVEVKVNNKKYLMQYASSDKLPGYEFLLFIDERKSLAEYRNLEISYKRFIPAYFLIGILIALYLSRQALKPVSLLEDGFDRLQEEDYNYRIDSKSVDESQKLLEQFNYMMEELNQRNAMRPFVSDAANHLFKIMSQDNQIVESNGAVLFSDIRSFTSISEQNSAEEIVEMLNEYFTLWQDIVHRHGGIIDRFEGDAISVVFLEEVHQDYMHRAVKTAQEFKARLPNFNLERNKQSKFSVENGIGIAESMVSFAVVGTEEKQEFFIYGDAPESAEYLEAVSKVGIYTNIMIDHRIYETTKDSFKFETLVLDGVETKPIYELKTLKYFEGEIENA